MPRAMARTISSRPGVSPMSVAIGGAAMFDAKRTGATFQYIRTARSPRVMDSLSMARRNCGGIDGQRFAQEAHRFLIRRGQRRVVKLIEERRTQLANAFRDEIGRGGMRCDFAIDVEGLARPLLGDGDLRRIDRGRSVVRTF